MFTKVICGGGLFRSVGGGGMVIRSLRGEERVEMGASLKLALRKRQNNGKQGRREMKFVLRWIGWRWVAARLSCWGGRIGRWMSRWNATHDAPMPTVA